MIIRMENGGGIIEAPSPVAKEGAEECIRQIEQWLEERKD